MDNNCTNLLYLSRQLHDVHDRTAEAVRDSQAMEGGFEKWEIYFGMNAMQIDWAIRNYIYWICDYYRFVLTCYSDSDYSDSDYFDIVSNKKKWGIQDYLNVARSIKSPALHSQSFRDIGAMRKTHPILEYWTYCPFYITISMNRQLTSPAVWMILFRQHSVWSL